MSRRERIALASFILIAPFALIAFGRFQRFDAVRSEHSVRMEQIASHRPHDEHELEVRLAKVTADHAMRLERESRKVLGYGGGDASQNLKSRLSCFLERMTRRCVSASTDVRVRIERLTDVTLEIEGDRDLGTRDSAEIARRVLGSTHPHVQVLGFWSSGRLVRFLDRRAIDEVADWGSVRIEEVVRLFRTP